MAKESKLVVHEFPKPSNVMAQVEGEGLDSTMAMLDRGLEIVRWATECGIKLRTDHLEMMCAAYFLKTDVDPRDVVLVEDRLGGTLEQGFRYVWYFADKKDIEGLSL